MLADTWPEAVKRHLQDAHGSVLGVDDISGMSGSDVWRVRFEASSVIVKSSLRETESRFYEHVAPGLHGAGVSTPVLELAAAKGDRHWIVIEDVPSDASMDREAPDPEKMRMLAALHSATRARTFDIPTSADAYRWTPDRTHAALSWFAEPERSRLSEVLARYEPRADALNQPWCWISGDPSAANWGRRLNGELVLFDWELFRPGIPATDLAITAAGLASVETFRNTAQVYFDEWLRLESDPLRWSPDELVADMVVAKLWTVVMLLAGQAEGRARVPQPYIDNLLATLPKWLKQMESIAAP